MHECKGEVVDILGTVPEWIAAFAAVAALGAAIWAGRTSLMLFRIESTRDRQTAERERQEQSSQISAWSVFCPSHRPHGEDAFAEQKDGFLLKNSSAAPIYNVRVTSGSRTGETNPVADFKIVPPGEFVVLRNTKFHWSFPKSLSEVGEVARPVTKHEAWKVRELSFIDARGLAWKRSEGLLSEVPAN